MNTIDQFAGAGGSSFGATLAGHEVIWAGNHDGYAIEAHKKNHPQTMHVCEDLIGHNYHTVPDHDVLMSSPACQGHSRASQPKRRRFHEELRNTAWATVQCLDIKRPEWVVVENVPNFTNWELHDAWLKTIEAMGYHMERHVLTATNHGVPQIRNRLFYVGRIGDKPRLTFDEPDYIPNFLDVMEDTDEGWRNVEDACKGDSIRIKAGKEKCGKTFLMQQTTGHKGVPLDEPIRTITTQDHWKLVDGDRFRRLTLMELKRCMGFPDDYILAPGRARAVRALGNAVCPPVMRDILAQAS